MSSRSVIYDTGMLLGILNRDPVATTLHQGLHAAPHRPIIIGPVLAQAWRPYPKTAYVFSGLLRDCTVPQTRGAASPLRAENRTNNGCIACAKTSTLDSYQRVGTMLAKASLPTKKRPDVVDALVVMTAALHVPSQILTSDPADLSAYVATLHHADITIVRI